MKRALRWVALNWIEILVALALTSATVHCHVRMWTGS